MRKKLLLLAAASGLLLAFTLAAFVLAKRPTKPAPLTLRGHREPINKIAFSPNGNYLASTAYGSETDVLLWNAKTGKLITRLKQNYPGSQYGGGTPDALTFSPDSTKVAIAVPNENHYALLVWNTTKIKGNTAPQPKLFDTPTDKNLYAYDGSAVAFSPDGKHIAGGCFPGPRNAIVTVCVWDIETGKKRLSLPGHRQKLSGIAFTHDGKYIATADSDDVYLWDAQTGKKQYKAITYSGATDVFAITDDNQTLITGSSTIARMVNLPTGKIALARSHDLYEYALVPHTSLLFGSSPTGSGFHYYNLSTNCNSVSPSPTFPERFPFLTRIPGIKPPTPLTLADEPHDLTISPDGTRFAYIPIVYTGTKTAPSGYDDKTIRILPLP